MACYTFASIAHPEKYGYKFDSLSYEGTCITSRKFRFFETYGDGMIQHGPDRSVTWELLTDYLNSLAAVMLTNDELANAISYQVFDGPDAEALAFASTVVYKESDKEWSKRRFFSMKLQKMGTRTKEHDKRYEEIRDWHDGSRAAMYRLLCENSYSDGFTLYQISEGVREWADAQKKYVAMGENWPKWVGGDHHALYSLRGALGVCRAICESARKMRWARACVEQYTEESAPKVVASSESTAA